MYLVFLREQVQFGEVGVKETDDLHRSHLAADVVEINDVAEHHRHLFERLNDVIEQSN